MGSPQTAVSEFFSPFLKYSISSGVRALLLWLQRQVRCMCPHVTCQRQVRLALAGLETMCSESCLSQGQNTHSQSKKSLSGIKWQAFANAENADSPGEAAKLPVCQTPTQSSLREISKPLLSACGATASFPGSQCMPPFCFRRPYLQAISKCCHSESQ